MSEPAVVTPRFLMVTSAAMCYFVAVGMSLPVLPVFVDEGLDGSGFEVGLSVGAFAVSAALVRPLISRLGDTRGRRFLVVGGTITYGVATLPLVLAASVPAVVGLRVLSGLGEAATFVGAATAAQDIVPPNRRGEAASYFSISVYGGLIVGPLLGEWVSESWSSDEVWVLSAVLAGVAAVLGWAAPSERRSGPPPGTKRTYLHHGAVRPGFILFVSLLGYIGFVTFVTIHARDVGLDPAAAPFAVFAVIVLVLRIGFARVPDRLGPVRTATIATASSAVGLFVIALWQAPVGIFVGTVGVAVGQSFLFPALFATAVESAAEEERSHAVGTFSFFFDSASAVGAITTGAVVAASSEPVGFAVGGMFALVALVLVRPVLRPITPT
jgi:MFS family permease